MFDPGGGAWAWPQRRELMSAGCPTVCPQRYCPTCCCLPHGAASRVRVAVDGGLKQTGGLGDVSWRLRPCHCATADDACSVQAQRSILFPSGIGCGPDRPAHAVYIAAFKALGRRPATPRPESQTECGSDRVRPFRWQGLEHRPGCRSPGV